MNDEQGLDQKAIDDLLADASRSLPELTETESTELQVPSVTDELAAPSPEIQAPQTALPTKNRLINFFKILKQHASKRRILAILSLFIVVIASSAFLGYKKAQHNTSNQEPLEIIIQQGITFEEKNFVTYAGHGDKDIVNAFLATGMSVNSLRPSDGWSPLIAASFHKKTEVVQLLLDKQATVDLQDKYGKTALMQAVAMGTEDIVTMLLEYGANPNLQDNNGRTALMEAYSKKQAKIAEILKVAGADPNIKPKKIAEPPLISPSKPQDLQSIKIPSAIGTETALTVGKAGFVQIGMPLAEIQKLYPTVTTSQKYVNGSKKTVATVYINGPNNPSLELELSNSNLKLVSTISTSAGEFLTDKQISINSTVGDIRNQYTTTDAKIIDNALYLTVRSMKMLFELDITNEAILNEWLTTGIASSIPADIKIKRIIIY